MTELASLLEQLRQGKRPALDLEAAELLLGWLTGSASRDEAGAALPRPDHDPVLLQMVLYRLDDELFLDDELNVRAAGVGNDEPPTRRRMRFRRLASAFHPDRFPELSDWLTSRSQAIHRAYARFKHQPDDPVVPPPYPAPQPHDDNPKGYGYGEPRKGQIRTAAEGLRARFGGDRYLAHKVIAAIALLALLPVANLMLVPDPREALRESVPVGPGSPAGQAPTSGIAAGSGPGAAAGPAGEGFPNDQESPARQAPTAVVSDGEEAGGPEADLLVAMNDSGDDVAAPLPPEVSPLLAAARRAMDPNGDGFLESAVRPSVDEQLAEMGLATDTERLYRRILAEGAADSDDEVDESAVEAANSDSPARQAPASDTSARADAAAGAGAAGEGVQGGLDSSARGRGSPSDAAEEEPSLPMRRIRPNSGVVPSVRSALEAADRAEAEGAGAENDAVAEDADLRSLQVDRRSETPPTAQSPTAPVSNSAVGTDSDPRSSQVDRRSETPPTDERPAPDRRSETPPTAQNPAAPIPNSAVGADSDPRSSQVDRRSETPPTAQNPTVPVPNSAVGADSDPRSSQVNRRSETPPTAQSPTAAVSNSAVGADSDPRSSQVNRRSETPPTAQSPSAPVPNSAVGADSDPRSSQVDRRSETPPTAQNPTAPAPNSAVGADSDPRSSQVNRRSETPPTAQNPTAPAPNSAVGADSDPRSSQVNRRSETPPTDERPAPDRRSETQPTAGSSDASPGELVLGPLASHPVGQLLKDFHRDLEIGNVAGIASRFTNDARHGSLRGQGEIADFYGDALRNSEARRVDLRVLRMTRVGNDWQIEADMQIEIHRDGSSRTLQRGRTTMRLENRGGKLAISRMEP